MCLYARSNRHFPSASWIRKHIVVLAASAAPVNTPRLPLLAPSSLDILTSALPPLDVTLPGLFQSQSVGLNAKRSVVSCGALPLRFHEEPSATVCAMPLSDVGGMRSRWRESFVCGLLCWPLYLFTHTDRACVCRSMLCVGKARDRGGDARLGLVNPSFLYFFAPPDNRGRPLFRVGPRSCARAHTGSNHGPQHP